MAAYNLVRIGALVATCGPWVVTVHPWRHLLTELRPRSWLFVSSAIIGFLRELKLGRPRPQRLRISNFDAELSIH